MEEDIHNTFIATLWEVIQNLSAPYNEADVEIDIPFSIPDLDFYSLWDSDIEILNELKRVFFRLTGKKDGCFVPLWDMMDFRPHSRYDENSHRYWFDKSYAHNWLAYILAQTVYKVPSPMEYDPKNAVFIKKASTYDIIARLDKAFAEWETKGKKMQSNRKEWKKKL